MTAQESIAKLNHLLDRVRRNAAQPRLVRAPAPIAAVAPAAAPVAAAPVAAAPVAAAPVVAAAPAAIAPVSQPTLLRLSSIPPASVTEPKPSTVAAAAPVTKAAQPEAFTDTELLVDDDILDITDLPADEAALLRAEVDGLGEEEEPSEAEPISSRRPKAPSDRVASAVEPELDLAPQTPPPESGPQVAVPPLGSLQLPPLPKDLEAAVLEAAPLKVEPLHPQELEAVALPVVSLPSERPAPVALVQPPAVSELVVQPTPVAVTPVEALSVPVTPMEVAPVVAAATEAAPVAAVAEAAPVPLASVIPVISEEQVVRSPVVSAAPTVFVAATPAFKPKSFLELLDASLALRGD